MPPFHPKRVVPPSIPKDKENHGRALAADGAMGLRWWSSLASKLAGYSITLTPPLSGKKPVHDENCFGIKLPYGIKSITSPESPTSSLETPDDTFVIIITLNLYNAQSVLWAVMFSLPANSCAALFYAVRQFYAIAIFLMGRLDTYGVGQKLWGVAASLLARLHPIAAGPLLY